MSNKVLIEIQNLVKFYKGNNEPAVNDLNLNVLKGEIFGLLGPNGAGKTTTISILCNLLKKTSGEIKIAGFDLENKPEAIKEEIGMVSQEIALYSNLTAFENLKYFGILYGIQPSLLNNKINNAFERLELTKQKHTRIKRFSGGMKRRINLLAGVLHNPTLLFLDEPTVGVDVQSKRIILEFLKELNKNGTTIFYTSHHLDEAEKFCSRIAIIDYGKIICKGSPRQLISEYKDTKNLEDVFIKLTGRQVRE